MPNQGKPKGRPADHFVAQFEQPIPGPLINLTYPKISQFKNYEELEVKLLKRCGWGGVTDYPIITYNKYEDEDTVERELRTEPWKRFAASVEFIFIRRVKA